MTLDSRLVERFGYSFHLRSGTSSIQAFHNYKTIKYLLHGATLLHLTLTSDTILPNLTPLDKNHRLGMQQRVGKRHDNRYTGNTCGCVDEISYDCLQHSSLPPHALYRARSRCRLQRSTSYAELRTRSHRVCPSTSLRIWESGDLGLISRNLTIQG